MQRKAVEWGYVQRDQEISYFSALPAGFLPVQIYLHFLAGK